MKKPVTTPKLTLARRTVSTLDTQALTSVAGGKPSAGGGCVYTICK